MSSTLPATQPLEALVRNGSLDFNQLSQAYRNVYGSIPPIADASPLDRNLIDVDDALALNSIKSLGIHEASLTLSLGTANEIEDKIKDPESAPGAAPFLSTARNFSQPSDPGDDSENDCRTALSGSGPAGPPQHAH